MVERTSRDASVEHQNTEQTFASCDIADSSDNHKFKGSFQSASSELVSLPKLELTGGYRQDAGSKSSCPKSIGENSASKIESTTEAAKLNEKGNLSDDEPKPGSAEAVAQAAEESEHAQFWKRDRHSRDKTKDGLFGCAIQASEVMIKGGAISKRVFGVGQLIEEAKENGWTEVKAGAPIEPGDLVIAYHPENPKAEGQRHAAIAGEPNDKGETMVWNNTNRTRLPDEEDRSKQWDIEPLSNLPYPAYMIYRAPEHEQNRN